MGEIRGAYKISVGVPEGRRSHGIPRWKREDDTKWILRK
jgi:hypothetical protein